MVFIVNIQSNLNPELYDLPFFVMQNGKLYRTICHPLDWSESPDYEMRQL